MLNPFLFIAASRDEERANDLMTSSLKRRPLEFVHIFSKSHDNLQLFKTLGNIFSHCPYILNDQLVFLLLKNNEE